MAPPLVSIIVPTVNTPTLTATCLESVQRNTAVPHELIVVANSRARPIRERLKRFRGIRVIQNPRNLGYTRAANQGILASRGQYLCFLNSDALVPPGWLERLLRAARRPGVGAVSPLTEPDGCRWAANSTATRGAVVELLDRHIQGRRSLRIKEEFLLSGFCLMIPREVFRRIGLFDERFFFGWEDIDFSIRLRLEGYRLLRVASLFVHHQQEGSFSRRKKRRRWVRRSRNQLLAKWKGFTGLKTDPVAALIGWVNGITRGEGGNLC